MVLLVLELNVRALKQSERVIFSRASLFVAPQRTDEPQEWRNSCLRGYDPALFCVLSVSC